MVPTKEEIEFFTNLVNLKEKEVCEKLHLIEPENPAKMGIIEFKHKAIRAAYSPKYGEHEDIYIFKLDSSSEPDINGIVSHEVTHRMHFWNTCMNSTPNITPIKLHNLEQEIIKTHLANEQPAIVEVLNFFNNCLYETFAYYGSMVVEGKEVKPLKYFEGDPKTMNKFVQRFLPTNKEDITTLITRLIGVKKQGFDISEILPNSVGHTVGTMMYQQFGKDDNDVTSIKNMFTGYDMTNIKPEAFDPLIRYVRLFGNGRKN